MSLKNFLVFAACVFTFGLLLGFYLLTVNYFSQHPEKTDFYTFYRSARFFSEGKSIYSPVPSKPPDEYLKKLSEKAKATMKTRHPNLNAPFHTLFVLPLGAFSFRGAFWVWSIFSLCLCLVAIASIAYQHPFRDCKTPMCDPVNHHETLAHALNPTLIKTSNPLRKNRTLPDQGFLDTYAVNILILWIIFLCYFPAWVNAISGQFGLFLLGSIILLWLSARKEKWQLAGIILGFALSVKIFLGLFLIFFAIQRRWRVLFWAVSVFILCNVISLITFGLPAYEQHVGVVAASRQQINASWNASFGAFFSRILGGAENTPLIALPMVAYGLAYGLSFLLTLRIVWTAWPRPRELSPLVRFDIGYSLIIVAMLLISPFGWMYYFPVLFIPLLVVWNASSTLQSSKLYKPLLVGAWILSSIPTVLINSEETAMNQPLIWFTTSGYYFYALIIFCGLLLALSSTLEPKDLKKL